jgi:HNH endonuclease
MSKLTYDQLLERAYNRIIDNANDYSEPGFNYVCHTVQHGNGISIKKNGNVYCNLGHQKKVLACRVVYEYNHGPIPSDKEISHRCANRLCVKISHLCVETHKENMNRVGCPGYCRSAEEPKKLYLCCNHKPRCRKITTVPLKIKDY